MVTFTSVPYTGSNLIFNKWLKDNGIDSGDHDWEYVSRKQNNPSGPQADDSVVVAPILNSETDNPDIGLILSYRPPLSGKPSKGLHWEPIGGLTTDKEAGATTAETAVSETKDEGGFRIDKLETDSQLTGMASSGGMTDETHTIITGKCSIPESHNLTNPDKVALKLVKVRLKQAFTFLKEQSQKGYNVALTAVAAVFNALHDLKLMPDFETKNIQETELWSVLNKKADEQITKFQENGVARLRKKLGELSARVNELKA